MSTQPRSHGLPDVEVEAGARAQRVEALQPARSSTRVVGTSARTEIDRDERENLPRPLRPGRVHHDVRVHRHVSGRLSDPGPDGRQDRGSEGADPPEGG